MNGEIWPTRRATVRGSFFKPIRCGFEQNFAKCLEAVKLSRVVLSTCSLSLCTLLGGVKRSLSQIWVVYSSLFSRTYQEDSNITGVEALRSGVELCSQSRCAFGEGALGASSELSIISVNEELPFRGKEVSVHMGCSFKLLEMNCRF